MVDIEKKFECEKLIFDNWDFLKGNFYDDNFELIYMSGPSKCSDQTKGNIQSGLMRVIYDGGHKMPFVEDFFFVSVDKKGEEFYYYDKLSKTIKSFKMDVYYNGTQMDGISGFGIVTYYEGGQIYKYAISFSKETMEKMQQDFINCVKKTYVTSLIGGEALYSYVYKGMINSDFYSDLYDLVGNLNEMNKVANGENPDILIQCILDNRDNINRYRNLKACN